VEYNNHGLWIRLRNPNAQDYGDSFIQFIDSGVRKAIAPPCSPETDKLAEAVMQIATMKQALLALKGKVRGAESLQIINDALADCDVI
jgi:hypothetical protein